MERCPCFLFVLCGDIQDQRLSSYVGSGPISTTKTSHRGCTHTSNLNSTREHPQLWEHTHPLRSVIRMVLGVTFSFVPCGMLWSNAWAWFRSFSSGQGPFLKGGLGAIRLIWRGELNSVVVGCPKPVDSRAKKLSQGHYVY